MDDEPSAFSLFNALMKHESVLLVTHRSLSLPQLFADAFELLKGRLKVLCDVSGEDIGVWEVGGLFEAIVLQPEDVQARLVPLDEFLVWEALALLGFVALLENRVSVHAFAL